ncbi:MAG: hypothetical protein ACOC8B_03545, partial [Gemmatimonadota bacterium]
MRHRTTVKLFVEDASPPRWIVGAIVCLYDRDRLTRDDHLGTDVTNRYGEATFEFVDEQFVDLDDRIGGRRPELYVEVVDARGERVLTTRARAKRNAVPGLIRVPVA